MQDDIQVRYGTVAMILHWVIAALLIANLALGLYFSDLPRSDWRSELGQLHKSIGLTVLVVSLLRLGWRLSHPVPPLPPGMNWALRLSARVTHYVFYFLIIAIPLAGWIFVSASPVPTIFFGLFKWPNLWFMAHLPRPEKISMRETFNNIHVVLAWTAIVLIPLHVLAALYHQYIRRDGLLLRMLPYRRPNVETIS